ncbi:ethionine resistance protein [Coemansia sp. RSA 1939]|nr:ethionine resistance protein [Coemansia sp. RSA 1939]
MTATKSSQQNVVQNADEGWRDSEATPLLQTSLSELDLAIAKKDTAEPYIDAAKKELLWIGSSSSLTILTNVLQTACLFINVFAVSHLGAEKLASMSLAMTCQGIFAMAPSYGLLSAMDTFCSTAYTASRNRKLVGYHFQRGIIALCIHFIFVVPISWNSEKMLLFLRQDPEIAHLTGQYLRLNILAVLPLTLFEAAKRFLQAQGIMRAATIVVGVVAPIQWVSNIVIVQSPRFGLGFLGVPVVNIISNWLMLGGLFIYIHNSRAMETWGGWSLAPFRNMRSYYRLAIPSVVTTCTDWVCFELLAIGTSYFGAIQLAGSAIMLNSVISIFQFSNGLGFGTCPRVGNLIGAAKPRQARIAADMAVMVSAVIGVLGVLFLSLCGRWWISVYTSDPDVAREAAVMIPAVCIFSLSNGLNAVLSAVLRGLGRQRISANLLLFGFYVCGTPIAIYAAYYRHWESNGLWWGLCIGAAVASILHIIYIHFIVNWKDEVHRCILRLEANNANGTNDPEDAGAE